MVVLQNIVVIDFNHYRGTKGTKHIILPREAEQVTYDLNLEGERGILRRIAEWGTIHWAKNKMGKGQKTKNIKDLEKCRQFAVAGVQGAGNGEPWAGSWMTDTDKTMSDLKYLSRELDCAKFCNVLKIPVPSTILGYLYMLLDAQQPSCKNKIAPFYSFVNLGSRRLFLNR